MSDFMQVAAYLREYAKALENKSYQDWRENVVEGHADKVRALADRVAAGWDGRLGNPPAPTDRELLREIATALASRKSDESLIGPQKRAADRWNEMSRVFFEFLGEEPPNHINQSED